MAEDFRPDRQAKDGLADLLGVGACAAIHGSHLPSLPRKQTWLRRPFDAWACSCLQDVPASVPRIGSRAFAERFVRLDRLVIECSAQETPDFSPGRKGRGALYDLCPASTPRRPPRTAAPGTRPPGWESPRELLDLGRRSRDFAARLVPPGTRVRLELDVQTRDRYGRLLAYLWLPDGTMLNERMLRSGWAMLRTIPPNVRYVDRFREAQRHAMDRALGLWAATGTQGQAPGTGCDPSYPDVCIPPPPPDLDCRDIPYRRFRVLPPDPHGFDRDRDGIGCER